ncbi:zf-HC2 domain-containing protein [Sphaerisporangium fuscum]|uniref:zf-HC2 domain-containing protein n=1 Tax=Sphaerisporangium fuscum TaxID=2835868 RepID=UPI001BDCAD93|nr:zf-HC2 domain-containing protein [Sphaerisporangium fuscum]
MTGDTHYDLEVLAELAEGLLDVATAARVREHLAVCDPCGESLADLAAVREVLAGVPVPAMPMGVALRIDKALSAEAETRKAGGGLKLDEAPDWDRIMADAPWETAAPMPLTASVPAEQELPVLEPVPAMSQPEEGVRLGVVADDGSIVPARRRKTSRRRPWAMPLAAGVAAAVVIGAAGASATLLSATGTDGPQAAPIAERAPQPSASHQSLPTSAPNSNSGTRKGTAQAIGYAIGKSGFNYSSTVLDGPLVTYVGAMGPGAGGDASVDPALVRCVNQISTRVGHKLGLRKAPKPIGVDQALYEGNEATVMAFWKDRMRNAVWVYVVDDSCKNIRQPGVGRWQ